MSLASLKIESSKKLSERIFSNSYPAIIPWVFQNPFIKLLQMPAIQ